MPELIHLRFHYFQIVSQYIAESMGGTSPVQRGKDERLPWVIRLGAHRPGRERHPCQPLPEQRERDKESAIDDLKRNQDVCRQGAFDEGDKAHVENRVHDDTGCHDDAEPAPLHLTRNKQGVSHARKQGQKKRRRREQAGSVAHSSEERFEVNETVGEEEAVKA